jgi:hypothetical protein
MSLHRADGQPLVPALGEGRRDPRAAADVQIAPGPDRGGGERQAGPPGDLQGEDQPVRSQADRPGFLSRTLLATIPDFCLSLINSFLFSTS